MMHRRYWLIAICAAVIACQNTGALHTRATAKDGVDFSAFQTYAQAPPPREGGQLPGYTEITGRRIAEHLGQRLEQAGLTEAPWEDADLQVAFHINGQARTEVWEWHYSWVASSVGSVRMLHGSLGIDVYEPARARIVWYGRASRQTMETSFGPDTGLPAVERLMDRFPLPAPGTGASSGR